MLNIKRKVDGHCVYIINILGENDSKGITVYDHGGPNMLSMDCYESWICCPQPRKSDYDSCITILLDL